MTHIHTLSRQLALHRPWQPRPSAGENVDHFNLTARNSFQKHPKTFQIEAGKDSPLDENTELQVRQVNLYVFAVGLLSSEPLLWERQIKHKLNLHPIYTFTQSRNPYWPALQMETAQLL